MCFHKKTYSSSFSWQLSKLRRTPVMCCNDITGLRVQSWGSLKGHSIGEGQGGQVLAVVTLHRTRSVAAWLF